MKRQSVILAKKNGPSDGQKVVFRNDLHVIRMKANPASRIIRKNGNNENHVIRKNANNAYHMICKTRIMTRMIRKMPLCVIWDPA